MNLIHARIEIGAEHRHKVFAGQEKRGKSSIGRYFGCTLHLLINHQGEILRAKVTAANVDDRRLVPELTQGLSGKVYGDRGDISKALSSQLLEQGVERITTTRKNMKPTLVSLWNRIMLKKRFIVEMVNDQLKNISQIEHSRHRSLHGFMLNVIGGLIAYARKPNKPRLIPLRLQGVPY